MKKYWIYIIGLIIIIIIGVIGYPIYNKMRQLGGLFSDAIIEHQKEFSQSVLSANDDKDNFHISISIQNKDSLILSAYDNNKDGLLGEERGYKHYKIDGKTIEILDDISEFKRFNISNKIVKHKDTKYLFYKSKSDGSIDSTALMKITHNSIDF